MMKTIREEQRGKNVLRLVRTATGYSGIIVKVRKQNTSHRRRGYGVALCLRRRSHETELNDYH